MKKLKRVLFVVFTLVFIFSAFKVGKALAGQDDFKLTKVEVVDKSSDVEANITSFNDDKIVTDVVFHKVGAYYTMQITLKNNTNKDYTIETITDNNTSDFVTYEYDKHENETLSKKGTLELSIKSTYKKSVNDIEKRDQEDDYKLIIKLVSEDGEEEEIVVPITGDNINLYIALAAISLMILIILAIYGKKNINKSLLVLVVLLPLIVKAITVNVVININNDLGLYDKVLVKVDNNGTKEEKLVDYNSKLDNIVPEDRPGYEFKGWYQGDNLYDFSKPLTSDTEIEAKYDIINYDISYSLDGGTDINPKTYTVEDTITLEKPMKLGFNFAGWTGSNGEVLQPTVTINKGTIGNLNYVAHFSIREDIPYTVIHKYEKLDGSYDIVEQNDVGVFDTTIKPEVNPREGFTSPSEQEITLKADIENKVEYIYTRNTYKITFNSDGGSPVTEITGKYGESITAPVNPTKDGYSFNGWSEAFPDTMPAHNVTLTATWSIVNYPISYELNGGNVSTSNPTEYNIENADITLNNPTRDNYTFAGWTGTGLNEPTITVTIPTGSTGNRAYTATWIPVNYSITYDLTGGNNSTANPENYNIETNNITLNNPERNGYTFAGWTGTGLTEPTVNVTIPTGSTGDRSYTATWSVVNYPITYNLNDGSVSTSNPTEYNIESADITLNNPTKEGYDFAGWTGTGLNEPTTTVTIPTGSTGNRTYNATWIPVNYSITYDLAGGNVSTANPENYNIETNNITLNNPEKNGYTFAGWIGTGLLEPTINVTIPTGTIGNRSYTATWQVVNYEITYNLNGGSVSANNPTGYNIESADITLNNPTKEGYVFTGWTGTGLDSPTVNVTIPVGSTGNRSYTATWAPDTYTITYDLAGGNGNPSNPTTYTIESENINIINPTKEGYVFTGWTGTGLSSPTMNVTIPTGSTGNKNYIANWEVTTYTIVYDLDGGTVNGVNPTTYTVESNSITLINPTRPGYTFTGWIGTDIDEPTLNVTIPTGSVGERQYSATWEVINYSITYDLAGGTVSGENPTEYNIDHPDITLINPTREGYNFVGWTGTGLDSPTVNVTIPVGSTGNRSYTATWSQQLYNYIVQFYYEEDGNYNVIPTTVTRQAQLGASVSVTNEDKTPTVAGYELDDSATDKVYSGIISGNNTTVLKVFFKEIKYTVTFYPENNNESNPEEVIVKYGEDLSNVTLPNPTYRHHTRTGWFTESTGGTELNVNDVIDSDKDYYAHWDIALICKKATELHLETCLNTGTNGCAKNGYSLSGAMKTDIIAHGNTSTVSGSDSPIAGDAYDCDVNGDGVYDKNTERFYYIGTDNSDSNNKKAILSFYSNFEGTTGINTTHNYPYDDALDNLPTFSQWSNLDVSFADMVSGSNNWSNLAWPEVTFDDNTKRQLVVDTDFTTKAARFLYKSEAESLCGSSFKTCDYLLENTSYRHNETSEPRTVRSGIWLINSSNPISLYRIQANSLAVNTNTKLNVTRPVIEVSMDYIDKSLLETKTITFNAGKGKFQNNASEITVTKSIGGAMREYPEPPTRGDYIFVGWYEDSTHTTPAKLPFIADDDKTYYAKWVADSNYVAMIGDTGYTSLQLAVNGITNSDVTTITLLKDTNEKVTISGGKNIILDLNDNTVSNNGTSGGNNVFIVNTGSSLEVYGGNVISDANDGIFQVNGGSVHLKDGNYIMNGSKQVVYNNGGTVEISGAAHLKSVSDNRATVHNINSGNLSIQGGTIESTTYIGVYNESGSLVIGQNGALSAVTPLIIGETYGLVAHDNYSFYDGTIKGKTYPIGATNDTGNTPTITNDATHSKITAKEEPTIYVDGTDNDYKTLHLEYPNGIYIITFNGEGGTPSQNVVYVTAGETVSPIPTATWDKYHEFDGWYKTTEYNPADKLTVETIPDDHITYHAKWLDVVPPSHTVTFISDGGITVPSKTVFDEEALDSIPEPERVGFEFEGWFTGTNGTGDKLLPTTTFTSDATYYAYWIQKTSFTVSFISDGGITVPDETVYLDETLVSIPEPERAGYILDGWYTEQNGQGTKLTANKTFNDDATYYAYWVSLGSNVAMIKNPTGNNGFYTTLQDAIDATPTDGTKEQITILTDIQVSSKVKVQDNHNVEFDLQEYTISNKSTFTNDNVLVVTHGELSIINGTITSNAVKFGTINVETGGILRVSGGTIKQTLNNDNGRAAIYVDKGTLYITGDPSETLITADGTARPAVQNQNSGGKIYIRGGTIESTAAFAIYNRAGTLEIGTVGTPITDQSPVIIGETYGVIGTANYSFYDGVIKGKTNPPIAKADADQYAPKTSTITPDTNKEKVTIDPDAIEVFGTDNIGGVNYHTYSLKDRNLVYVLTFDANGGTPSTTEKVINKEDPIGSFPPGITYDNDHTFVGWFTSQNGGEQVTTSTVPTGDDTYYAHWSTSGTTTLTVTYNANGGNVSKASDQVEVGDTVSELPTPTYTPADAATFVGWFTEETGGTQVTSSTPIEDNMTVYAHWNLELVTWNPTNNAMKTYYQYIDTWKTNPSNFPTWTSTNKKGNSPENSFVEDDKVNTLMLKNFNDNNCNCTSDDIQCYSSGTVQCDKPIGYDTGLNSSLKVYLYDTTNNTKGAEVSYAKATNGVITNLIPGQVYYWELASNTKTAGLVKFQSERRILDGGDVQNLRDLGGMPVDTDNDGTIDGHLKYEKLFRGIRLKSSSSVTELSNLGIDVELDLREANSDSNRLGTYTRVEAQNYYVNPFTTATHTPTADETNFYNMTRAGVKEAMEQIVAGKNVYFHCRIGTDRTGTVAWVLEGLLGVPEEERVRDYELSFFYGLVRIHRYHNEKPGSTVGTGKERFVYMHDFMPTNQLIYDWYMFGSDNVTADQTLIANFRSAMIVND